MAAKTRFLNPDSMAKPSGFSQVVEITRPGALFEVDAIAVVGD